MGKKRDFCIVYLLGKEGSLYMRVTMADPAKWGISSDSAVGRKMSDELSDPISTRSSSIFMGNENNSISNSRASMNFAIARRRSSLQSVQQAIIEEETVEEEEEEALPRLPPGDPRGRGARCANRFAGGGLCRRNGLAAPRRGRRRLPRLR